MTPEGLEDSRVTEAGIINMLAQRKASSFAVTTIEMDQFLLYAQVTEGNLAMLSACMGALFATIVQCLVGDTPWWVAPLVGLPCVPCGWTYHKSRKQGKNLFDKIRAEAAASEEAP